MKNYRDKRVKMDFFSIDKPRKNVVFTENIWLSAFFDEKYSSNIPKEMRYVQLKYSHNAEYYSIKKINALAANKMLT